jgi:polysaccharide pyruvyl transferase WcaK-like protein
MKILVWNPYFDKKNVGDELFKLAYKTIFPNIEFTFVDQIKEASGYDAIFIGGGSFLDSEPNFNIDLLKHKKVFYIGVGAETQIHSKHKALMQTAKAVFPRSSPEKTKELNSKSWLIPDLAFALKTHLTSVKEKSICIIPNACLIPSWKDPIWKHNSWEWFKTEFSQYLEAAYKEGFKLEVVSLCENTQVNDTWAGQEIFSRMANKPNVTFRSFERGPHAAIPLVLSKHSLIITQRYHGIILAQMTEVPYVAICHHDKLLNADPKLGSHISYYAFSKDVLKQAINQVSEIKNPFSIKDFAFMKEIVENEIRTN